MTVDPSALDHFVFDPISTPQTAGVDFVVKITAYDEYENIKTDYVGMAVLTESNGGVVDPADASTGWVEGVWEHVVNVSKGGTNVNLHAADGSAGNDSGSFDVNPGPLDQIVYEQSADNSAWSSRPAVLDVSGTTHHVYFRIRLLDHYGNPLANLSAGDVTALDLDITYSDDDGAPYEITEVEVVPQWSGTTDAAGFVDFGTFAFGSGASSYPICLRGQRRFQQRPQHRRNSEQHIESEIQLNFERH